MTAMIWASTGDWRDVVYNDKCWAPILLGLLILVGIMSTRRKKK